MKVARDAPRLLLDASLERAFLRDRLRVSAWGRNLLAQDPYVQYYNSMVWTSYPATVHSTYGGGLEYRF